MFGQSVTKAIIILGVGAADGSVESGAGGECHPCVGVIVLTLSVNVTKLSSLVTGHHLDSHLPTNNNAVVQRNWVIAAVSMTINICFNSVKG